MGEAKDDSAVRAGADAAAGDSEQNGDFRSAAARGEETLLLRVLAGACGLAAVLHAFWPKRFDESTALLLGLAALILIVPDIAALEIGGLKFRRLERKMDQMKRTVGLIEASGVLPGQGASPGPANGTGVDRVEQETVEDDAGNGRDATWNSDPNADQFGGQAERNGRRLEATIRPASGPQSAACRVRLTVRSTDEKRPLTGNVIVHLHPTFGRWKKYPVKVRGGVATTETTSWGVFTVGVEADEGKTRLELNLRDVPGGTKKFYGQ